MQITQDKPHQTKWSQSASQTRWEKTQAVKPRSLILSSQIKRARQLVNQSVRQSRQVNSIKSPSQPTNRPDMESVSLSVISWSIVKCASPFMHPSIYFYSRFFFWGVGGGGARWREGTIAIFPIWNWGRFLRWKPAATESGYPNFSAFFENNYYM